MVTTVIEQQIARITMDDGKVNALSPTLLAELDQALDQAEKDSKAVVLTGREGRFSAGFDLRVLMSGPENARSLLVAGFNILLRLYDFPKPVVIACTGHALAGGALLVATGDQRLCAQGDFKIGLNEVQKGMPMPILAHSLAADRLDPRHLFQAVVQAEIYDPKGAQRVGWVDEVVEPGALLQRATEEASRLAQLPATAYALSKSSLRRRTIEHIRATLEDDFKALSGS